MSIVPSEPTSNGVPEPVTRIANVMSGFSRMWCVCGGWAVDAWLGRQTREHSDLDIAVFQDDLGALSEHLAGWQLIAHDSVEPDSMEAWQGRRLYLPAHVHARLGDDFNIDVRVNESSDGDWVLSGEPRVTIDLSRFVETSGWALPTLVPEVILFYKAQQAREQDETDFHALLPYVDDKQRRWLREGIELTQPGHSWLPELSP